MFGDVISRLGEKQYFMELFGEESRYVGKDKDGLPGNSAAGNERG